MLRYLVAGLFMCGSLTAAQASSTSVEVLKNVVVNLCGENNVGCAPHVELTEEGKRYLLDQSYVKDFLKENGNFQRPQNFSVAVKEMLGVVVTETGHLPNPNAEFEVLKVLKIIK